jgi:hypothetical protein
MAMTNHRVGPRSRTQDQLVAAPARPPGRALQQLRDRPVERERRQRRTRDRQRVGDPAEIGHQRRHGVATRSGAAMFRNSGPTRPLCAEAVPSGTWSQRMTQQPAPPAPIAAALAEALADKDLLFVASEEGRAEQVAAILAAFAPDASVLHLPSSDALPGEDAPASLANIGARVAALRGVRAAREKGVRVALVTTAEATAMRYAAPSAFDAAPPGFSVGDPFDLEGIPALAADLGYVEDDRVDEPGEIAVRGAVVDAFPVDSAQPVRIEAEGGRVVSIRRYDPVTQLAVEELDHVEVGRASEPEAAGGVPLTDHLPDATVALDADAGRRRDRFLRLSEEALKGRIRDPDPLVARRRVASSRHGARADRLGRGGRPRAAAAFRREPRPGARLQALVEGGVGGEPPSARRQPARPPLPERPLQTRPATC